MVQMYMAKVWLDAQQRTYVILADAEQDWFLPILIGAFEAHAIAIEAHSPHMRPLTHELLGATIEALGYSLIRIDVTRLTDGIFYALLHVEGPDGRRAIDARPSDGIALAICTGAPIFVAEQVLNAAGIKRSEAEEQEMAQFRELLDGVFPDDTDQGGN